MSSLAVAATSTIRQVVKEEAPRLIESAANTATTTASTSVSTTTTTASTTSAATSLVAKSGGAQTSGLVNVASKSQTCGAGTIGQAVRQAAVRDLKQASEDVVVTRVTLAESLEVGETNGFRGVYLNFVLYSGHLTTATDLFRSVF